MVISPICALSTACTLSLSSWHFRIPYPKKEPGSTEEPMNPALPSFSRHHPFSLPRNQTAKTGVEIILHEFKNLESMVSLLPIAPIMATLNTKSVQCSKIYCCCFRIGNPTVSFPVSTRRSDGHRRLFSVRRFQSHSNSSPIDDDDDEEEEEEEGLVQDLRVPENWLDPSKALEESEWLRVNLHKWLDDEYCPEPTNVEISNVAAHSFYNSLVENQADLGEILLKMARELESISYQESFHGAFSSANAAVNLIIQRLDRD